MAIVDNVWTAGASSFMSVEHTSQKHVLHPTLASLIDSSGGGRLLDYGCGDGRLLSLLQRQWEIDVYDTSPAMLTIVQERVGTRITRVLDSAGAIPTSSYDVVVLSMVLVTIATEGEFRSVLSDCRRALAPNGRLFVAVTHPCFREYRFSNVTTSFGGEQVFRYLEEGTPFTVNIEDEQPPSVSFVDFHWPLAFTLNAIVESGLSLIHVIETPDDKGHPRCNDLVSPFLILTCERHVE